MDIGIIILIIAGLFLGISRFIKVKARGPAVAEEFEKSKAAQPLKNDEALLKIRTDDITIIAENEFKEEDTWWKGLSDLDQLRLTLMLGEKALPVWEKYALANDTSYRDSISKPYTKIDHQLLQVAITEMQINSRGSIPAGDSKIINECYFNFVGPVIAMHDGTWMPPYPVKKIFLGVYYMLKSIVEQDKTPARENYFATAINQLLDCLDMSKLYSREEIALLLEDHKAKV